MKKLLLIILPLLWIATAAGQGTPCWYDSLRLKSFASKPQLKQDEDLFYYRLNKWRNTNTIKLDPTPMYVPCSTCLVTSPTGFKAKFIIPVVVHIIHLSGHSWGTSSNISDTQVLDQIANLNRYFANYNNTNPKSVNTGIQFCLAPVGSRNNGIIHKASTLSNHNPNDMKLLMDLKPNTLPYRDYLHIYVVNELVDGSGSASGIKGYATFPGGEPQGIVIRYKNFGNTSTCTGCSLDGSSLGKVLVHEVGHFLGVQHPFEGGCVGLTSSTCASEGDKCCDVPPVLVANSGCSPTPLNSCTGDVPDSNDMLENYMDYTNDLCRTTFTKNQAEIMHFTLFTLRSWLINPEHINDVRLSCESFSPRFSGTNTVLCIRDSVRFTALKYTNVTPTYLWEFKKGNTIVYSASTNSYKFSWYPPSGFAKYQVTLKMIVGTDTATDSIPDMVQIIDCGSPIKSTQGTWYFGEYAGLKFMQKAVVPEFRPSINPQTINTGEGCVSVCDTNGRLLFYGGGNIFSTPLKMYNQNHTIMSNDSFAFQGNPDLDGHGSSAQGIVAFPNPSDRKQYMIINNSADIASGVLTYSIFDTIASTDGLLRFNKMNRGIKPPPGFVYIKHQPSYKNYYDTAAMVYEQVIAIPKCNGRDYWMITTPDSLNSTVRHLAVYSIDSAQPIKYFSRIKTSSGQTQGYIKVSPDGNYLAFGNQVFKFNTSTGIITKWFDIPWSLNTKNEVYGLSFSPKSQMLYYVEGIYGEENIYQLNLALPNPIANRQVVAVAPGGYFQALQLGPDNKLYVSEAGATQVAVIQYPDKFNSPSGRNPCGYTENGPYTQIGGMGGTAIAGLPNMVDAKKPVNIPKEIKVVQSHCDSIYLSSSVCCASTYEWDFGDGTTHIFTRDCKHKYASTGTYTITLKTDGVIVKTQVVKVGIPKVGILGSTLACDTINAKTYSAKDTLNPYYQYTWTSNKATISQNPQTPNYADARWHGKGTIYLDITDRKTGCTSKDSLRIRAKGNVTNNTLTLYPTQTLCKSVKDSISGTVPTGAGIGFKYGWVRNKPGTNWFQLGENTKYLIPEAGTSGNFKRIVYDSGCEYESNVVIVKNFKNTISGKPTKCTAPLKGSDLTMYSFLTYQWQYSNDSFATDSHDYSGLTTRDNNFANPGTARWVRRLAIQSGACTTRSNIIRIDVYRGIVYEKDMPFERYICSTGYDDITFNFLTGLERDAVNESNQYYKKPYGGGSVSAISNHNNAAFYNDRDTVYCIQTIPGCGTYTSRKCIIRKASSVPSFTTHPTAVTKVAGTSGWVFRCVLSSSAGVKYIWQFSRDNSKWYNFDSTNNNDTFFLTNLSRCQTGGYYRVQAYTKCGTVNSNSALLTVTGLGAITQDYWMKDNWKDTGRERDIDSNDIVQSVDLWVRNLPDNKKPGNLRENEMIAEGDNYIYYTVRNRGIDTAKHGKLFLYWTWGGTGQAWPKTWTYNKDNMYESPNTGNKHPLGSEINQVAINLPNIKPKDSTRGYFKWEYNVPKPTWFFKYKDTSPVAHICLLARIETCDVTPFGMSYTENSNLNYNVIGNNNIVTRNSWMRYMNPPKDMDFTIPVNGDGEATDVGTTVIENIKNVTQKNNVCINITNSAFLTKANLYIEMSTEVKYAWVRGGSISSGITWVQDNLYRLTSANACLDSIQMDSGFLGTVRAFASYKNPDDRFTTGDIYPISITQKGANGVKIGQVWINITDNPFKPSIIPSSLSLTACGWQAEVTNPARAKYTHSYTYPYTIKNITTNTAVTNQPSGIYSLVSGTYLVTSIDSPTNTVYQKTVTVSRANIDTTYFRDTISYDCATQASSVIYVPSGCANAVLKNKSGTTMTPSIGGFYDLNPHAGYYILYCPDSSNCRMIKRIISFKDNVIIPPTVLTKTGHYNRQWAGNCCYVELGAVTCETGKMIAYGQPIKIFDLSGNLLTSTTVQGGYLGYGGSLGFFFCPPKWNTSVGHLNDAYTVVYRNDTCKYCKLTFHCDSFIYIPSDLTSGGDSSENSMKAIEDQNTTGISNINEVGKSFQAYPNPTNNTITLEWLAKGNNPYVITVCDMLGKIVYTVDLKPNPDGKYKYIVPLSDQANGVYTVKVSSDGFNYTTKVTLIK
jgi:hypothetical protein